MPGGLQQHRALACGPPVPGHAALRLVRGQGLALGAAEGPAAQPAGVRPVHGGEARQAHGHRHLGEGWSQIRFSSPYGRCKTNLENKSENYISVIYSLTAQGLSPDLLGPQNEGRVCEDDLPCSDVPGRLQVPAERRALANPAGEAMCTI